MHGDRPENPVEARLLCPPPVGARLVRPPGSGGGPPGSTGGRSFGDLLRDGLRAARRSPGVVAGIFFATAFAAAAWVAALLVFYDRIAAAFRSADAPGAMLALIEPSTWIVPLGILLTGEVLAAALELLVWAGGLGVLDRAAPLRREEPPHAGATFARTFGPAFPRLVLVAACMAVAGLAWLVFTWTLGGAAAWILAAGTGGERIVAAAGLALAAVVWIAGAVYLPLLYEIGLARAAVAAEAPLAAIHGAFRQLLGRPLALPGIGAAIGFCAAVAAVLVRAPAQAALVEGAAWSGPAVVLSQLLVIAVAAFAAVTRFGAWVSAVRASVTPPGSSGAGQAGLSARIP